MKNEIKEYKVLKNRKAFVWKGKTVAIGKTIKTDIETGSQLIKLGLVEFVKK